ncbi:MAG: protein-L-isoaspartate(D-aspartate) O-methyltransferase, partial [Planctomycetes bacterium]|nr:protein-L-isoaspartate(D-aspartate) O-methyltransferase [Planctomycetota bacterium]
KYENVHTKIGDGFQGWAEHAPFDKIIVTCSPEKIPPPLVEQLREGGMIVIPLGERYQQSLYRFRKVDGEMKAEILEPTFFVPMTGTAESLRQDRDESGMPELVNGDFESTDEDGLPTGWYYVRQATVVPRGDVSETSHYLQFSNATAGRGAQALQAMGIDGRQVREVKVELSVKCRDVRAGQSPKQVPCVVLNFFDGQRSPIQSEVLGPWTGTSDWTTKESQISVPARSRLAVLAVGMFGAVGELAVDDLSVRAIDE